MAILRFPEQFHTNLQYLFLTGITIYPRRFFYLHVTLYYFPLHYQNPVLGNPPQNSRGSKFNMTVHNRLLDYVNFFLSTRGWLLDLLRTYVCVASLRLRVCWEVITLDNASYIEDDDCSHMWSCAISSHFSDCWRYLTRSCLDYKITTSTSIVRPECLT